MSCVAEAQWKIFEFRQAATSSVVATLIVVVVVVGARGRVKGKEKSNK